MNKIKNFFKSVKDWINSPPPSYICSDCGEEVIVLGPGAPTHKCDVKKVVRKTILEMKKEGTI